MKNITDILKDIGIEVPADKLDELKTAVAENYKTTAEHEKKLGKLEAERDQLKERAEAAEATLKGFDGIDADKMRAEITDWKAKAEAAEKEYTAKLAQRDYEDALKSAPELADGKFTSKAAKAAIVAKIRELGLRQSGGKILGLGDALEMLKSDDSTAFVDETQAALENNKARFTEPMHGLSGGKKPTGAELMKMKNENPNLDISKYI